MTAQTLPDIGERLTALWPDLHHRARTRDLQHQTAAGRHELNQGLRLPFEMYRLSPPTGLGVEAATTCSHRSILSSIAVKAFSDAAE